MCNSFDLFQHLYIEREKQQTVLLNKTGGTKDDIFNYHNSIFHCHNGNIDSRNMHGKADVKKKTCLSRAKSVKGQPPKSGCFFIWKIERFYEKMGSCVLLQEPIVIISIFYFTVLNYCKTLILIAPSTQASKGLSESITVYPISFLFAVKIALTAAPPFFAAFSALIAKSSASSL